MTLHHISALVRRLYDTVDEIHEGLATLISEKGHGASGRPDGPPPSPLTGVITTATVASRGAYFYFTIDGLEMRLPRGVVAETLTVLLEPGSVVARDGHRYHPVGLLAETVADRLGRARQSDEAVRSTVHRARRALGQIRDDAHDLILFSQEVRGYRLSRAETSGK